MMRSLLLAVALLTTLAAMPQTLSGPVLDYAYPKEYTIGGIQVFGCVTRDTKAVELFSGLQVGDKVNVPGERIGRAIQAIWDQHLFTDVRIEAAEIRGNTIFLNIIVQENPQLVSFNFGGTVSRNEADKLREELKIERGMQVNEALAMLQFSKKHAAVQIIKVVKSAVANAEAKARAAGESVDVDDLYVTKARVIDSW